MSSLLPRRALPATARRAVPAAPVALLAALVGVAGCSGEDREFVEAAEVGRSGLQRLGIVAPADYAGLDLTLAPGERIDFDVAGSGAGGADVEISDADRDWTVTEPAFGTIDRNGRFTAVDDGTATVRLRIGGVRAAGVAVTVSSAPINAIAELRGPDAPDPCVAARYVATGTFDDGTTRLLADTTWSLPGRATVQGAAAPLQRPADDGVDGAVEIVPRAAGPLVLSAAARGLTRDETLQVPDNLTGLAIDQATGTSLSLRTGDVRDLTVTATFTDADATVRTVDVTDNVDFGVDQGGNDFGRVSNLDGSRGSFEALARGTATVRASCGAVEAPALTVSVGAGGTTGAGSDGGLSFDFDRSRLTLSLTSDRTGRRLRVSTGSRFDEDEIDNRVDVSSDDPSIVRVDTPNDGTDGVVLFPITVGSTRVVARERDGSGFESLDVTVVE